MILCFILIVIDFFLGNYVKGQNILCGICFVIYHFLSQGEAFLTWNEVFGG